MIFFATLYETSMLNQPHWRCGENSHCTFYQHHYHRRAKQARLVFYISTLCDGIMAIQSQKRVWSASINLLSVCVLSSSSPELFADAASTCSLLACAASSSSTSRGQAPCCAPCHTKCIRLKRSKTRKGKKTQTRNYCRYACTYVCLSVSVCMYVCMHVSNQGA